MSAGVKLRLSSAVPRNRVANALWHPWRRIGPDWAYTDILAEAIVEIERLERALETANNARPSVGGTARRSVTPAP